MKKIILIYLVTSMALYSCSNSNEDPKPVATQSGNGDVSNTESGARKDKPSSKEIKFLAGHDSKSWHVTNYFINGVDYIDILFKECSVDNIQMFNLQDQYIEIEGATKCNPSDPDIFDQGTYEFNEDFTKFTLLSSHLQVVFDVVALTPTKFRIKYLDPTYGEVELWLEPAKKKYPK